MPFQLVNQRQFPKKEKLFNKVVWSRLCGFSHVTRMGYNKTLINITKLSGRAGRSFDIKSVLKYGGAFDRQIEKPTPIHSTCQCFN